MENKQSVLGIIVVIGAVVCMYYAFFCLPFVSVMDMMQPTLWEMISNVKGIGSNNYLLLILAALPAILPILTLCFSFNIKCRVIMSFIQLIELGILAVALYDHINSGLKDVSVLSFKSGFIVYLMAIVAVLITYVLDADTSNNSTKKTNTNTDEKGMISHSQENILESISESVVETENESAVESKTEIPSKQVQQTIQEVKLKQETSQALDKVTIKNTFSKKKEKTHIVTGIVGIALIVIGAITIFRGCQSDKPSGMFAGMSIEEAFPRVHDVVEVDVESANLRLGPGADYVNAVSKDHYSRNRIKMQTWRGQRLLIDGEEGDWYRLTVKDADGSSVYIKRSLCKDINRGMIDDKTVFTDWVDPDFECGGGITVTHRSKGNRLIVMYKHHYCDSDDLLIGTYQQGMYVFYYSTFLMNKICDGEGEEFSYNQESHDIHYGKKLTRKASYNSDDETEIDWDKVSEDHLAEIFRTAIDNKSINIEVVTANDIDEAKKHENDDGGGYDDEEVTDIR